MESKSSKATKSRSDTSPTAGSPASTREHLHMPTRGDFTQWRRETRGLFAIALLAVVVIGVGFLFVIINVVGGSKSSTMATQTGTFTKTTMTCPGQQETHGDTCLML